jgi:SPP1 family predicted phage head-tail adaptor
MQAGDLDDRIAVYRQTRVKDAIGGNVITWNKIADFRAHVKPMSGRERDHAAQTIAPRNYRITVRKSSKSDGISQDDRILWRGTAMLIRFIGANGARPMYIELEAEERVQYLEGLL